MNKYLDDALYNLRRASRALSDDMGKDELCDAIVYFAFGIEKVCKAVVHDVNPVLLLEARSPENVVAVLYADRLRPGARALEGKEKANQSLIPFQPSMLLAARFCSTVQNNIGTFTQLAEYRGVVAHRSVSDLDSREAAEFLLRNFHPTVTHLSEDLNFETTDCFESPEKEIHLQVASAHLAEGDNAATRVQALLAAHRRIWNARKCDVAAVERIDIDSRLIQGNIVAGGPYPALAPCPACGQDAILLYKFAGGVDSEEGCSYTTGRYVVAICCKFCDLCTENLKDIDYLKLNELLASAAKSKQPIMRRRTFDPQTERFRWS